MIDSTKPIDDATLLDDISGLKLSKSKSWTLKEIYIKEAENIVTAMLKYASFPSSTWECILHPKLRRQPLLLYTPRQSMGARGNGNGRWARMLANIYLRQKGSMPVRWQEDLLAKENPKRAEYIKALKKADNSDYKDLIAMHKITYE